MTSVPPGSPSADRRHRYRLVAALTAVLLLAVVPSAHAYWTATSTGPYARAQASVLPTPNLTSNPVTPTSVALSWTRPFAPTGYTLSQSPGALADCVAAPAPGSTGCTATGLTPNTTYTWTLTSSLHNWVTPVTVTATTSPQATTTTLSNLTPMTGPAGTSFSATATVSGYNTPAGTVVFSLYTTDACGGTASYTSPAQTLSGGGTASATLQPAPGTYYWQAAYTPSDPVNLTSTSGCSAAVTVTPAPGTFAGVGDPVMVKGNKNNVDILYPAGTVPGDLLLVVIVNNTSSKELSTIASTGWNFIAAPEFSTLGMRLVAWWHTAGIDEDRVTFDSLRTDGVGATAWVVGYKNLPNPALAGVSSGTAALASSITPNTLTTTAVNTRVISLAAANAPATLSLGTANNFSFRASLPTGTPTGRALGVADRFLPTAGPVTPPTWTNESLVSLNQWAYITVAFTSRAP